MFGKRIALFFLIGILVVTPALAGCAGGDTALMQEYKEEGIALMEAGDYAGAVERFQAALDQSVGQIRSAELDICYYRALALFLAGQADEAIEAYTALIDYDADNWEVYYLRGNVYLKDGQEDAALSDYAEAAARNADDPQLCVHIYANLCNAGLESSALSYRDAALSMVPSSGEDYYYLGELYYLDGDYESARNDLQTAREMGYEDAILLLGSLYSELGDSESAQEMFTEYMTLHPDDAGALGRLGEMALSAGEYEDAIDYLTRALQTTDEENLTALVKNLVAAYEYAGDFANAYRIAGEYLTQHEDAELAREYAFLETRVDAEASSETEDGEVEGTIEELPSDEESGDGN